MTRTRYRSIAAKAAARGQHVKASKYRIKGARTWDEGCRALDDALDGAYRRMEDAMAEIWARKRS